MLTTLLLLALLLPAGTPIAPPSSALRDGDPVFQESRSAQGAAVALVTGSRLTHVGVVLLDRGRPLVLEAVAPAASSAPATWHSPPPRSSGRSASGTVRAASIRPRPWSRRRPSSTTRG